VIRMTALTLSCVFGACAYVPNPFDGAQLRRTDYSNIQFLANQNIAAGMTNADGAVWITPDSSPMDAIDAAIAMWNAVPQTAAHFLPVQTTSLSYNPTDGNQVIVFADDAYTRSYTNGVIAFTVVSEYVSTGTVLDTDILFSPLHQFSTTNATGTYDIQAILTHELGHSLGANHTNILSAAMFWATAAQDEHQQTLTPDDMAFVCSLYPREGRTGYGIINGVATVGASPLAGGLVTAADPVTGVTVGGFTSVTDGSFSFLVPPGNYYVYVEPGPGLNLYATPNSQVVPLTSFQSAFAGGNSQPSIIGLQEFGTMSVNLTAAPGLTALRTPYMAIGAAGVTGDFSGSLTIASIAISSGQSVDLIFSDPMAGAIAESNIQVIGPANLRAGSLRRDVISLSDGTPIYRFTLDIPPLTANASASLVFRNGSDILTRSAVLNLTRPQAVNAGSFLGGPVAPGEILSFFGSNLGPNSPMTNSGFDSTGTLPSSLGGIGITFDQTAAPLFYVSNKQINLQVPYEVSGRPSTLMTVSYNGAAVSVAKSAPGIFVVTNSDGSVNGPSAPISAGGTLVIYGTGAGVTSGLLETGQAAPANSTIAATLTIGGRTVTPDYAGMTQGSVGLTQVNVVVPAGTASGTVPLQYSMNGSSTQTVNITVK
jgi:uncharacterized protein (TIGR03437 family)